MIFCFKILIQIVMNKNLEEYFKIIDKEIQKSLKTVVDNKKFDDILLNSYINKNEDDYIKYKKLHNLQMKMGKVWEIAIYNYKNNKKINNGLDIINKERKYIIELKNRYNTCNSGSKNECYRKLSHFKKNNKEYKCIFAFINVKNEAEEKTLIYNKQNIHILSGDKFLKFIFENDYEKVLKHLQNLIEKIIS